MVYPIDISRFLNRLMCSPWRNTGRGEIPDPSRLEKSERAMKTEKALARLASNRLDDAALAELYRNDKVKIDGIITQWFGKGTIATDALSRVLVRIAENAVHFRPQFQKSEDFIVGHAVQECQRLYSEANTRIALAHFSRG